MIVGTETRQYLTFADAIEHGHVAFGAAATNAAVDDVKLLLRETFKLN